MANIDELREKINEIDDKLLRLLNDRARLSKKIGTVKNRSLGEEKFVLVPEREREIQDRLFKQNREGPFPKESVKAIFREIFSASRALQKPINIAYLGPEATFTHQAAVMQFGYGSAFISQPTIEAVFLEVEKGRADYGVVPIENSIEGAVNQTLDCFVETPLLICDELKMGISLYLISSLKDLREIKTLYSHPQPFAQCRSWLNQNLFGVERMETASTARAAEMVLNNPRSAAVASKLAGEHYELNILAEKIEDRAENYTRFLVVSKVAAAKAENNKTSIMFSIKDESGALLENLQEFARGNINLSKIQSRPLPHRTWEYLFFVDFDGHLEDHEVATVIESIRKRSLFLKVLGSYPKKV